jgi:hypothetical protein
LEIWVDGVLHGVGNDDPNAGKYYTYMCNPQMQMASGIYPRCQTPVMAPLMTPSYPPGDYTEGLPSYSTFLIGCDASGSCFRGRMDEVRISNIQRTFEWTVVPTVTPTPTQTPVQIGGEYTVDSNTLALFHLNYQSQLRVYDEVSQGWGAGLGGNAVIAPSGRYGQALSLDGNGSFAQLGSVFKPGNGTIEMWINLTNLPADFALFSSGNPDGSDKIYLGFNHWSGNTLVLAVVSDGSAPGTYEVDSGFRPLIGCWHHVAGTWGSRGLEIWVDGTLRSTYGYYGSPSSAFTKQLIGCSTGLRCVTGMIDEVRLSTGQRTFSRPHAVSRTRAPVFGRTPDSGGAVLYLPIVIVPSACPN